MVARWRKLPAPGGGDHAATVAAARTGCEELQKFLTTWPSWLFARGDVAAGGAGDESPLVFNDTSLKAEATHHFIFNRPGRGGGGAGRGGPPQTGPAKFFLNVASVNPSAPGKPVILWRNPTIGYRRAGAPGRGAISGRRTRSPTVAARGRAGRRSRCREPVPARSRRTCAASGQPTGPARAAAHRGHRGDRPQKLGFGKSPDGSADRSGRFCVRGLRLLRGSRAAGRRGHRIPGGCRNRRRPRPGLSHHHHRPRRRRPAESRPARLSAIRKAPATASSRPVCWSSPPFCRRIRNSEPTPADKDPVPEPFDSTYNMPEHDEFDNNVKYIRDDRFVYENMLDDATRARLDNAWNDLRSSFAYHDNYLQLLAEHYKFDLKGKHIVGAEAGADRRHARRGAQVHRAAARRVRCHACRPKPRPRPAPSGGLSRISPAAPGAVRSPKRKSRACGRSTTRRSPPRAITTRPSARCSPAFWSRRHFCTAWSSPRKRWPP